MKPKILLALFCLGCITFVSCQKEVDDEINPVPPSVVADSSYIDKIYFLDKYGATFDTSDISSFFYDTQKRLVSIRDSFYDADQGVTVSTFFYNGSDTVPYKKIERNYYAADTTLTTTLRYYDAQNRVTKDSVSMFEHDNSPSPLLMFVADFTYSGNKIMSLKKTITNTLPQTFDYSKDTTTLDAFGNAVLCKNYVEGPGPGGYFLSAYGEYTYDNKISPGVRWQAHFELGFISDDDDPVIGARYNNRTNAINRRLSNTGGIDNDENYSFLYEYNNNGFPSVVSMATDDGTGTQVIFKRVYLYKAL